MPPFFDSPHVASVFGIGTVPSGHRLKKLVRRPLDLDDVPTSTSSSSSFSSSSSYSSSYSRLLSSLSSRKTYCSGHGSELLKRRNRN